MFIDVWYANDTAAIEAAADMLAAEIVHIGEGVGAFIRRESVWVTRGEPQMATMQMDVVGVWSPDPAQGVELRGGACDGQVMSVPRESDGRPMPWLSVPIPVPASAWGDTDMEPRMAYNVGEYARAGIDSERDRWVYESR
jgi:hypothetical protein